MQSKFLEMKTCSSIHFLQKRKSWNWHQDQYTQALDCFEHSLLNRSKGLGTSSNNLRVPLLKLLQSVMQIE